MPKKKTKHHPKYLSVVTHLARWRMTKNNTPNIFMRYTDMTDIIAEMNPIKDESDMKVRPLYEIFGSKVYEWDKMPKNCIAIGPPMEPEDFTLENFLEGVKTRKILFFNIKEDVPLP